MSYKWIWFVEDHTHVAYVRVATVSIAQNILANTDNTWVDSDEIMLANS